MIFILFSIFNTNAFAQSHKVDICKTISVYGTIPFICKEKGISSRQCDNLFYDTTKELRQKNIPYEIIDLLKKTYEVGKKDAYITNKYRTVPSKEAYNFIYTTCLEKAAEN